MRTVHVVVPDGIDDPSRPSGGNVYDRHVCRGLTELGWSVHEHPVPGAWPLRDVASLDVLGGVMRGIPDGAAVLLDGLIASTAPEVLLPEASRLRLVVLVHMPLGHDPDEDRTDDTRRRECAVLSGATAIVTTSDWTRHRLSELYSLPADGLHVAQPGAEAAELATGTGTGRALLCVATVRLGKGHDVLLDALTAASDLAWHCVCVGRLDREPAFVKTLRRRLADAGLGGRVDFPGPRTGPGLDHSYALADLLVLPSRSETYGMVITEALARGLPVIASDVGGVSEAVGYGRAGIRPGMLVPPTDPVALTAALRGWLGDAELRQRWRRAARERRESLARWSRTTSVLAGVLTGVSR